MRHHRFLFDRCFDGPADTPADPADRRDAAAEREAADTALIAARAEGFSAGHARGLAEAGESAASHQSAVLENISDLLDRLLARAAETEAARTQAAARLALSIARRMVPVFARTAGFAEIETVVADCLRRALDEPRIVLRVGEDFFDTARRRIEPLARDAGFAGRVIILADPQLESSDCRVEWADGGTERDTARLWRDIENTLSRTLAAVEREPAADAA